MTWADDLKARIGAAAGVAALAGTRVAWFERGRGWKAQGSVLLNLDDDGRLYTHDGPNGLIQPVVEIDCFGPSGAEAWALAETVKGICEAAGVTVGATKFLTGFVRAGRTLGPEDMPDGARVFRRRLLVRFSIEQV
ncbi:MAG TPA: hypothetical protein PKD99_02270 [Sphingopyxis sp.]|nr:hypothetical protein [Sphingopyxis sp.]HMP43902.1 hypothetical protein [Sphingopyxis sp.]HMQ18069.1 hypothetical protein [Sphingopyxis sp.]